MCSLIIKCRSKDPGIVAPGIKAANRLTSIGFVVADKYDDIISGLKSSSAAAQVGWKLNIIVPVTIIYLFAVRFAWSL